MDSSTKPFGVLKIAAAYIGTVVGAGFASGQEVLRFFTAYGPYGIWGIAVAAALFFFIGYSILLLGRRLKSVSHVEVVRHTNGIMLGSAIDLVVTLFLFGGMCTMLAGAGAIFREQFSLGPLWGTLTMAAVTLLTVLSGTRGVVNAISYVVPFLIVTVMFIFIRSLLTNPVTPSEVMAARYISGATPHWLLSAVNYASYNIVISIGVLAPIGAVTPNKRTLFWGALLGTAGLMLGMGAIYYCLITDIFAVAHMEVPMAAIAQQISDPVRIAFAVVLFAEVYTTAVGNLYAFSQRLSLRIPKPVLICITVALGTLIAQMGFSNMVRFVYPAVGYGGILFFAGVAYTWIKKRDSLL